VVLPELVFEAGVETVRAGQKHRRTSLSNATLASFPQSRKTGFPWPPSGQGGFHEFRESIEPTKIVIPQVCDNESLFSESSGHDAQEDSPCRPVDGQKLRLQFCNEKLVWTNGLHS